MIKNHKILFILLILFFVFTSMCIAQNKEVIDNKNEFGGQTIEQSLDDFSRFFVYYDSDGNLAKEETVYTSDYPIENNLTKLGVYYYFGKKTHEERIYSSAFSSRTLISKSIDYFDRNTGELVKQENHFVKPFAEYNVIYRENGKKTMIEWFYPDNEEGIRKNVSYFDEDERIKKTETFYTQKTAEEEGYLKRIYFNAYNTNQYMRKSRQEWFYTDNYAKKNDGIAKKVELFHYAMGAPTQKEVIYYDRNDSLIKTEQK